MARLMSERFSPYRVVAVVVAVVVGCYGCCVPKGFFGPVRVLRSTVTRAMPDTSVQVFMNAYDADNKRVAIGYPDQQNSSIYIRNILDFRKGMEFIVTSVWTYESGRHVKCTKYPLKATWREACVPGNATESWGFYMGHPTAQYYRQMDALAFTYTEGSIKAKAMVTQDTCALVGEVVYDISDPVGTKVINRLYVNQSMDISVDFFKLPLNVTCVPDPNPPAMSPWQRMGLFGWLLGLRDN